MPEPASQPETSGTDAGTSQARPEGPPAPSLADATIAEYRQAGEHRDAERAIACLAANVTLISPLTARFTFDGRDQVANVIRSGFDVISQIRYHTEVGDDRTRALFYYGSWQAVKHA